jgi:transaldolase
MKLFLDSADINEITQVNSYGVLDGLTTNPSLIKKAVEKYSSSNFSMESYILRILKEVPNVPVSLEVTALSYKEMLHQAKTLYSKFNKISGNVFVKIPINTSFDINKPSTDSIKLIKRLSHLNIPVNCTLVFTPEQALLAAKAGAKFVSPFSGRIDDFIRTKNKIKFNKDEYFPQQGLIQKNKVLHDNGILSGVDLIEKISAILKIHSLETEVLAASLRNTRQVREVALAGADIATIPFDVFPELLSHEKTVEGVKNFTKDVVKEYSELLK